MADPFKVFNDEYERLLRFHSQLAFLSVNIKEKRSEVIKKRETENYYIQIKSLPIIRDYEDIVSELDKYITMQDSMFQKIDLYSEALLNECREFLKDKDFNEDITEKRIEFERLKKVEQILKDNNIELSDISQSLNISNEYRYSFQAFDEETKKLITEELKDLSKDRIIWTDYAGYVGRLKKRLGGNIGDVNRTWIFNLAQSFGYIPPATKKAKERENKKDDNVVDKDETSKIVEINESNDIAVVNNDILE